MDKEGTINAALASRQSPLDSKQKTSTRRAANNDDNHRYHHHPLRVPLKMAKGESAVQQAGPSLRMVPGPASSVSVSVGETSHPVHTGVHDTMRHGPRSLAAEASAASAQHPLHHRLEQWDETRDNLKLTMQRNMFGMAAPIRTLMERRIVEHNPHFPALHAAQMGGRNKGMAGLHRDILNGDDEMLEPVDFLPTTNGAELLDIHAHMERKHGI